MGIKSMFSCYYVEKIDKKKECLSKPLPYKRYKITSFKKNIGVTTCNILGSCIGNIRSKNI